MTAHAGVKLESPLVSKGPGTTKGFLNVTSIDQIPRREGLKATCTAEIISPDAPSMKNDDSAQLTSLPVVVVTARLPYNFSTPLS